jgi:hypothetical protein
MPILKPPRKNEKFKSFGIVFKITFSQRLHIWRKLILSGKQLPEGKKKVLACIFSIGQ